MILFPHPQLHHRIKVIESLSPVTHNHGAQKMPSSLVAAPFMENRGKVVFCFIERGDDRAWG